MAGIGNLTKIPELRRRLFFTIAMIAAYRFGIYVPTPGINIDALTKLIGQGTVFEIFNLFSGGALEQFSVFALGIMPYISASIILQLLTISVPTLERLSKEGESGRKKITQYTRYGTIVLSFVQALGISFGLEKQGVLLPGVGGFSFWFMTAITLSSGTCLLMWMGEQISERGIGNGISLVIFSGIVARIPSAFRDAWFTKEQFGGFLGFVLLFAFIAVLVGLILFFERAQRRIPIHYAKRVVGRKLYGAQTAHLPLKINMAGVIPPIFASSILLFPATIAQFSNVSWMQRMAGFLSSGWFYIFFYVTLIIFFCYFYTAVTFNPVDVSDNLKKNGGYIPGIRPGRPTSDYLDRILSRITLGGAFYIAMVCVLPQFLIQNFGVPPSLATTFGGTSLLIIVGVGMDTIAQVEAHLLSRNYEGFMGAREGRFRGRRG